MNCSKAVNSVWMVSRPSVALAMPKSMTLGTGTPSWRVTRMLEGLMSRWMMPFWWACWMAFADLLKELVAPEGLADGVVGGIVGEVDPEGGSRVDGGVEEVVGGVVRSEEGLDALAEGLIAKAGTVEEGCALGGGPLEGGREQGFFEGGVHGHAGCGRVGIGAILRW